MERRARLTSTVVVMVLSLVLGSVSAAAPAHAAGEAPPELTTLCLAKNGTVAGADTRSDCRSGERVIALPQERTVMCVDASQGTPRIVDDGAACTRDHEVVLVLPDDGVQYFCRADVVKGVTQRRGNLRQVGGVGDCTRTESLFASPSYPLAVDDAFSTDEDTPFTSPGRGVLANDTDYTGGPLRVVSSTQPTTGQASLSPEGVLSYDPRGLFEDLDAGQSRSVALTYSISDGALTSRSPATVTLTVLGRADAPTGVADSYSTDEDTQLAVPAPGVLGNDRDPEGGPLTATLVDGPALGSAAVEPSGAFAYSPVGTLDGLREGETSRQTFTYTARDGSGSSSATTVDVTVRGVNDAPVGHADAFRVPEGTTLTLTPAQLTANDVDADDPATDLVVTDVTAPQPTGTARLDEQGRVVVDAGVDPATLEAGQTRDVRFTYRAGDGRRTSEPVTVTVTVEGASAPSPADDTAATDEDSTVVLDLLANDTAHGGRLVLDTAGTAGRVTSLGDGRVEHDPRGAFDALAEGATATDRFAYTLTNAQGTSRAGAAVTLTGRNDAPSAGDVSFDVDPGRVSSRSSVLSAASDPDTSPAPDRLTARLVAPPEVGRLVLQPDGSFSYDPLGEAVEGDLVSFRFRASDGRSESTTAVATLRVRTNRVPTLVLQGRTPVVVLADAAPGTLVTTLTGDDDGPLRYALTDPSGQFQVDATTGAVTVRRTLIAGLVRLTGEVTDEQGAVATLPFDVRVAGRFLPQPDTYLTVGNTELVTGSARPRGEAHVLVPGGVLSNDGAPGQPGETITVTAGVLRTAQGGTVDLDTDGSFTYLPPRGPLTPTSACGDGSTQDDCFSYRVTQAFDGEPAQGSPQVVEVTLRHLGTAFYVRGSSAAPPTGDGTSTAPYTSAAAVSGAAGDDTAGDTVVLLGGGRSPAGLDLLDRQRLLGPAGLTVGGVPVRTDASLSTPVLAPSTGTAVGLAAGNEVRGFVVEATGLASGVVGAAAGDVRLDLSFVQSGAGAAVDVLGTAASALVAVGTATASTAPVVRLGGGAGARFTTVRSTALGGVAPASLVLDAWTGTASADVVDAVTGALGGGVLVTSSAGTLVLGRVTARGTEGGLTVRDSTTQVEAARLDWVAPATGGTGLEVVGGSPRVRVRAGELLAGSGTAGRVDGVAPCAGAAPCLRVDAGTLGAEPASDAAADPGPTALRVTDSATSVLIAAAVRLAAAEQPDTQGAGHSVVVDGLRSAGSVTVTGLVTDRGRGLRLSDNVLSSTVRFSGGLDVATTDVPALSADATPLEVTGAGNRLSTSGGTALRLVSVRSGPAGVGLTSVDSDGATRSAVTAPDGAESVDALRPGHGVQLVAVTAAPGSPGLVVGGGTLDAPQAAGVLVDSSSGVTLGELEVRDATGTGVALRDTDGVLLLGTQVRRSGGDGITSTDDTGLRLQDVQVDRSRGRGVALAGIRGRTLLQTTRISGSGATQLDVVAGTVPAAGPGRPDVLALAGTTVSGGVPERPAARLDVSGAGELLVATEGDLAGTLFGGNRALDATARAGGLLTLRLSALSVGNTDEDAVHVQATGGSASRVSDVDVRFTDLTTSRSGGVQLAGRAGIRLVGDGPGAAQARVHGVLERVEVRGGRFGIVAEQTSGLDLVDVSAEAAGTTGVRLVGVRDVELVRPVVTGAPTEHGVVLWDTQDVAVTGGRVDLRALSAPTDDPYEDRDVPAGDWCGRYQPFGVFGLPSVRGPVAKGSAAVYARHFSGLSVTSSTLRGATLHGLVAVNGAPFSTLADPGGLPAPAFAPGRLTTGGLDVRDTPRGRVAALLGAGGGVDAGELALTSATTLTDAPVVACAVDAGSLSVTGSPSLRLSTARAGLTLKAGSDLTPSRLSYALTDTRIEYLPGVPTVSGLEDDASGVTLVQEGAGVVDGTLTRTTVVDAPGVGATLVDVSDRTLSGLTLLRPRGGGLVVRRGARLTVTDLVVTDAAGGPGALLTDTRATTLVRPVLSWSAAYYRSSPPGTPWPGLEAVGGSGLTVTGAQVTRAGGPSVLASGVAGLTLTGGTLDAARTDDAGGAVPLPAGSGGLQVRNTGPLDVSGTQVTGVTGSPAVDVLAGSSYAGTSLPSCSPCTGALSLGALTVTGTEVGLPAVRVGAGNGAALALDLPAGTSLLSGPLAVDAQGGRVAVTGSPDLTATGAGAALAVDGGPARAAQVDLVGATVTADDGPGVVLTGLTAAVLRQSTVTATGGSAVTVQDVARTEVRDSALSGDTPALSVVGTGSQELAVSSSVVLVSPAPPGALARGVVVDGLRCAALDDVSVLGADVAYTLLRSGLSDHQPFAEAVSTWLERHRATPSASEEHTDVTSC